MTNDPNLTPNQQWPTQPQPPQFGQSSQQGYGQYHQTPPQFQQAPNPSQVFGSPPQNPQPQHGPKPPKSPFGVSFWIVGSLLALIVLSNTFTGHGETILIVLGVAAGTTGLYSLIFRRRSWASLPDRNFAVTVAVAGAVSLLAGGIAAGVSGSREATTAQPLTSAELEAGAVAKLKAREDTLVKSEADSAAKLATREDAIKKAEEAVKVRETNVGGAEAAAAANTIKEGTWTVGRDIAPGTYRTTTALTSSCYWAITRTGSNGSDILENDNVKGGFPMVILSDGQTFESSRCGSWAKQ